MCIIVCWLQHTARGIHNSNNFILTPWQHNNFRVHNPSATPKASFGNPGFISRICSIETSLDPEVGGSIASCDSSAFGGAAGEDDSESIGSSKGGGGGGGGGVKGKEENELGEGERGCVCGQEHAASTRYCRLCNRCTQTHTHTHAQIHTHTYTPPRYTHTHTQTCTRTPTHTHTHTLHHTHTRI